MTRPEVRNGEDRLQKGSVEANILNKQARTAESEWSSSLAVNRGSYNPSL